MKQLARAWLCFNLLCLAVWALAAEPFEARVAAVVDGDTIRVVDGQGQTHRIRLAGIDAPEKAQPFSRLATQRLRNRLNKQTVWIKPNKTDRYGRTVAQVRLGTVDVGLEQVRAGLAWYYKAYEAEMSAVDRTLYEQAETEARQLRRGLWQEAQPVAPWDFRRERRNTRAP